MNNLNNRLSRLLAAALALGALAGCSTNSKFVTSVYQLRSDTFYAAYTDYSQSMGGLSSSFTAKVRKCSVAKDNSVVCTEQEELNKFLNLDNAKQ